jgi:two-component sensor histidine kinase
MSGISGLASDSPGDEIRAQLEFWHTAAHVASDVDAGVWTVLEQHPELGRSLARVLTEALTNAVKHGTRAPIKVKLASWSPEGGCEGVRLELRSGGHYTPADAQEGLGLRTMRDLTEHLEVSAADGTVHVTALISVHQGNSQGSMCRPRRDAIRGGTQ